MASQTTYRSKIELLILIPVILVLGSVMALMIVNSIWIGIIVCGAISLVVASIYFNTLYIITSDGKLLVKCGVIENYVIDISDIEFIRKSHELSNAPALGFNRLEVSYKGGRILISPKNPKEFLNDLRKINSRIWTTEV